MAAGFCSSCGRPLQPDFRLCPFCGAPLYTSGLVPVPSAVSSHLTRRGTAAFIGFSVLILAFSVYIVLVDHDLTALLLGVIIAALPWLFMGLLRRPSGPPASRTP
jgi:hypothetical protein